MYQILKIFALNTGYFEGFVSGCGFSASCHYGKHSNFYSVEKEVA